MKRPVLCAFVPVLAWTVACAHGGSRGPTIAGSGRFSLKVSASADVDHPVLEIKAGQTEVVWNAPASIELLWVAFKPTGGTVPSDPTCEAATCTLPATGSEYQAGEFSYVVGVKPWGKKKWTIRDPKLIIKP